MNQSPKLSHWQTSRSLARSAWQVLQRDRSLSWLPVLSGLLIAGVLGISAWAIVATSTFQNGVASNGDTIIRGPLAEPGALAIGFYLLVLLAITYVGTLFNGALVAGALQRFRGNKPSVSSALAASSRRAGSLMTFGLFSATIGTLLRIGEERIPIISQILSWAAGAAWAVVSMFAVPVIVSSQKRVGPIAATKKSFEVIRKTWGENIILMGGIGLLAIISIAIYFAVGALITAGVGALLQSSGVSQSVMASAFEIGAIIAIAIFLLIMLILTVLSAIVKAAVYHYATTGQAPELFERDIVRACFTPKKAREIFTS